MRAEREDDSQAERSSGRADMESSFRTECLKLYEEKQCVGDSGTSRYRSKRCVLF